MVEIGSTIGNYEVLQKIGQGAMGAVFLARHPTIGKRVALKIIHPELATDEDVVSRFFNEARAVTQIGHQNIVDVQDFGQTPAGESFLVMELLEGVGLGELLRTEGPLSIERAVKIAIQLTDGLQAAHARGIVHRDLKPDNIHLIKRGNDVDFVKILDFGLAKLTGPGAITHKTKTGVLVGTPHYMAPEAAESPKLVDHRIDVYSLGCIVFQMVTGRVPFPGDGFGEVVVRHLREPPPMPSRLRGDVPPWLEKLILHALAKKQQFRLPSMEAFGSALRDPEQFERAFDDDEVSARHVLYKAETPTPTGVPGPGETPVPRAMAQAQLPSDAKTLSVDAATVVDQKAPDFAALGIAPAKPTKPKLLGPVLGSVAIMLAGFAVAGWLLFGKVRVTVDSVPPGAVVSIDGKQAGQTPLKLRLDRGKGAADLLVQHDGYLPQHVAVDRAHDGKVALVLVAAEPTPTPDPKRTPTPTPDPKPTPIPTPDPKPTPTPGQTAEPTPKAEPKPKPGRKRSRSEQDGLQVPSFENDGMLMKPKF